MKTEMSFLLKQLIDNSCDYDQNRELKSCLNFLEINEYEKAYACLEVADLYKKIDKKVLRNLQIKFDKVIKESSEYQKVNCMKLEFEA